MIECLISNLSKQNWDKFVDKCSGDYRQFYNWGEVKKSTGWSVERVVFKENENLIGICQFFVKKRWPIKGIYIPGSISGNQICLEKLIEFIKNYKKKYFFNYLRIDFTNLSSTHLNLILKNNNLNKTLYKRIFNTMLVYKIEGTLDNKVANLKKNWRKSYKSSLKNDLSIEVDKDPNLDVIYKMSKNLEKEKKLSKGHSHTEVMNVFKSLKDNLILVKCLNNKNEIIAFRAAIYFGRRAWDFFAVTPGKYREYKPGFPTTLKLIEELQLKGVKEYYFMGEDPIQRKNIYSFKKGLGCMEFEYIGEREWSNISFLKIIINYFLKLSYK